MAFKAVQQIQLDLGKLPWVPIEQVRSDLDDTDNPSGVEVCLLSENPETGAKTYVARLPAGWRTEGQETHDFDQQSITLAGSIITDMDSDPVTMTAGSYRCTPAGVKHGPSYTERGVVSLQIHSGPVVTTNDA